MFLNSLKPSLFSYKKADGLRIYGLIISFCKRGLEYFCVLIEVIQKSGQNLGLDSGSQLPAQHPVHSCALVPSSKDDLVEMHFICLKSWHWQF